MRALLERSHLARSAVAAVAAVAVLALAHAAVAGDDLGLRRAEFWPEPQPSVLTPLAAIPTAGPLQHRPARRIWAASRSRPLRIVATHVERRDRLVALPHRVRTASLQRSSEPQVALPKLIVLPKPPRPALVSIYQDRTLRDGDAVMMSDGIHIFRGVGLGPYRPRDFVRLTLVAALDWHLRQTLDVLDRSPPMRWSSLTGASG